MEKGQYIRYYSLQDIAHGSIKEKSLHISSRARCPTNAKSLVLVFLQMVKSSLTTAEAQNYLILLCTKKAEGMVGYPAVAEKAVLNVT